MEDNDVLTELGGFALGQVLTELDLDFDDTQLSAVGLQARKKALTKESIYEGRYEDDDGEDDDNREDWEAAVDREMYDETRAAQSTSRQGLLMRGEEDDYDEDEEDDEQQQQHPVKAEPQDDLLSMLASAAAETPLPIAPAPLRPKRAKTVNDLFPRFRPGATLEFTDMFATRPRKKKKSEHPINLRIAASDDLGRSRSTVDTMHAPLRNQPRRANVKEFMAGVPLSAPVHGESTARITSLSDGEDGEPSEDEALVASLTAAAEDKGKSKWVVPTASTGAFDPPEVDDWETKIIWSAEDQPAHLHRELDPFAPRNEEFDRGVWVREILWSEADEGRGKGKAAKLNLNLNDVDMLLEVEEDPSQSSSRFFAVSHTNPEDSGAQGVVRGPDALALPARRGELDPLNLSGDKAYEVVKEQMKKRIRQTFGTLEVLHAHPAVKLQLPFYKLKLDKSDTRAFHRPAVQFSSNIPYHFSKLKSKKKKDESGRKFKKGDQETLRSMNDVTLKDTGGYVLCEYSEESPPILSNIGMGNVFVNYYRKRNALDSFAPQLDIGEPFLLDPNDESPFKSFGTVSPGETVSTLYNNMFRAPIFRHKPPETDFLVIKHTINNETKYFIRSIRNVFVVGQTYPVVEVPGPNSRKVTNLTKARLQFIAQKLVEKHPKHRIKVARLNKYFPDQNDLQMRQRLKEFMEYNRRGDNQGYWTLKDGSAIPDDNESYKMATPEMVCLNESMQVGQRHLQDLGYGGVEEGGAGDDDSKLDVEQQMAPWITTKNFLNATSNKAMLKLHGDGDPTGRGEAFSFLRTSMKDIFLRDGEAMEERLVAMADRPKSAHRYNVQEQQEVYKEEIARIWKAQGDALRNPQEPILTEEDEERYRAMMNPNAQSKLFRSSTMTLGAAATPASLGGTPRGVSQVQTPNSRGSTPEGEEDQQGAAGGESGDSTAVLRIRRLIKGEWKSEIVRDPSVIKAYQRQRQLIEEEQTDAEALLPSDDEGKNEIRRKRLIAQLEKLKKNQERRLQRKNAKLGEGGHPLKKPTKTEAGTTTRVCSNCGQRGHMKTSRKLCPRWAEFNTKSSQPTASLSGGFGGGMSWGNMQGSSAAGPSRQGGGGAMSPPAVVPQPRVRMDLPGMVEEFE